MKECSSSAPWPEKRSGQGDNYLCVQLEEKGLKRRQCGRSLQDLTAKCSSYDLKVTDSTQKGAFVMLVKL